MYILEDKTINYKGIIIYLIVLKGVVFMAKVCLVCGVKVGFFSGKFIGEKYVCKSCYELHELYEKENEMNMTEEEKEEKELDSHNMTKLSEAYAKPFKYKPWSWGSDKKSK
jgi:hypothetical protein